ncbi:MAG: HAD domain-containing protein [Flavobacteriaceae bacterium]|nr:HAD domain-containing protein [Flavobacteriaceae bacterium]
MKIIFLDIDGVMNNQLYFKSRHQSMVKNETREEYDLSMIDDRCVDLLNHVVEKTEAKIVISSSWRLGRTVESLVSLFEAKGFKGEIIDKTPVLNYKVFSNSVPRGCEIKAWIDMYEKNHDEKIHKYVILDDDSDMLLWQRENYFRVDGYSGLTPNLCYRVINFLN